MGRDSKRSGCARTQRFLAVAFAACAISAIGTPRVLAQTSEATPSHSVVVRLSPEALRFLLARPIEVELDVDEEILDARIKGRAHVVAQPDVQFVSSDSSATFQLVLKGTAVTRTTGEKGVAIVQGRSHTKFTATRPVVFDTRNGFQGLETEVSADTHFVTDVVSTRTQAERETGSTRGVIGRVFQRRASERLEQRRPDAVQAVQRRMEQRIREAVERRIDQRLARLNRLFNAFTTLSADGEGPILACSSTPECVLIGLRKGDEPRLHWPNRSLDKPLAPAEVWIHRSLFSQAASGDSPGQAAESDAWLPLAAKAVPRTVSTSTGLRIRSDGDWVVVAIGRPERDAIRLAQQPNPPVQ